MTKPVSLRSLLNHLDLAEPGQALMIDRHTGAVVQPQAEEQIHSAMLTDSFELLDANLRGDELEWARRFAGSLDERETQDRLRMALAGSDPFAAFESCVYRCGIAHKWFRFRDEQIIRSAKEWLEAHGLPYLDDLAC